MSGPWEDFGGAAVPTAGPWQDFGGASAAPINKLGADAFPDFLRKELANTDWGTRNIAGFGTALSEIWQGAKQLVGKGDAQQIDANRIIEKAAPVGAVAGNIAVNAIPFGMVGNTIGDAAKVGTIMGALAPVEGDQSAANVTKGKILGAATGGALSAAGQIIANKAGDVISNKMADLAAQMQKNAPKTKTLNDALDAGLVVPPSSVDPSWWNTLKDSIGGKTAIAQQASNANAPVIDDLARKALYLAPDAPLESGTMQAARDAAYQAGYKPVADTAAINWDPQFIKEVGALSPASTGGAVKNPAQAQISDLIDSLANKNQWTGQQLVGDIRALRDQARTNWRAASVPGGNAGSGDLARAQSAAADALEGLAQRNITIQGGSPDALELMRQARQYIAKAHDVEDSIVEGGGTIDPRVLARKFQNGAPLSDELKTIAAFANNYKSAAQPAAKVQGPGVSNLGIALALMNPGSMGGAEIATQVLGRPAVRAYQLSGMSQNRLRDLYKLGLATRATNGLLKYAPVAGAVLGREALTQ